MFSSKKDLAFLGIVPMLFAGICVKIFSVPVFLYNLFCIPAAWLACLYTDGNFVLLETGGAAISRGTMCFLVGPECSGVMFFIILLSLVFFTLISEGEKRKILFLTAIPASFIFAVVCNSFRIVSLWQLRFFIPDTFIIPAQTVHLSVGVFVFLSGLIVSRVFLLYLIKKTGEEKCLIMAKQKF